MSQKNYQELQKTFESPAFRGFLQFVKLKWWNCWWEPQENRRLKSDTTWSQVDLTRQWWTALRTNLFFFFSTHGALPFLFNFQKLTRLLFIFLPIVTTCALLYLKPLPLSHHFTQPRRSTCRYLPCLKTSLTFRLSLKMTLPSTIACGNIIRPTLNFNWYAVPGSSWGNYHSVHNKNHNMHLENDYIIHCASIKVSCDPSEKHTHTHIRARARCCSIIAMKWKPYYAYDWMLIWWFRYAAGMIGRCVGLFLMQRCSLGWRCSETPVFLKSLSKHVPVFFPPNKRMV